VAKLTNKEVMDYAAQLVQCLQMWDVEREDAAAVSQLMREMIRDCPKHLWVNPLSGTGFSAIKATLPESQIKKPTN